MSKQALRQAKRQKHASTTTRQPQPGPHQPPQAQMQALVALFTAGRYDEAQTAARDLTVRYPRHFFGWKALGTVLSQLGRAQEALPVLEQALVRCPTDTDTLNNPSCYLHGFRR